MSDFDEFDEKDLYNLGVKDDGADAGVGDDGEQAAGLDDVYAVGDAAGSDDEDDDRVGHDEQQFVAGFIDLARTSGAGDILTKEQTLMLLKTTPDFRASAEIGKFTVDINNSIETDVNKTRVESYIREKFPTNIGELSIKTATAVAILYLSRIISTDRFNTALIKLKDLGIHPGDVIRYMIRMGIVGKG